MGFEHNLEIEFNLQDFVQTYGHPGYVTMGDHNAYISCSPGIVCNAGYDTTWFPSQGDIIGHARGEIPWFGLIKLLITPTPSCAHGWGDPCAPANSWNDLAISIVVLIALPFLIEGAAWAWSTLAWPWLKPRLSRIRGRGPQEPPKEDPSSREDDQE
jgi:signal peptidase